MLFTTLRTELGGGEEAFHIQDLPSRPLRLVAQESHELPPAGIRDRLGQLAIPHHPLDVQIFDGDAAVAIHQPATQLMVEVPPLIGHPLVRQRQPLPGLLQVLRPRLLAAQSPL